MKNKEFKTLIAVVSLTGALLLSLTSVSAPVYAADPDPAVKITEDTDSAGKTTTAKPYKNETVYATINADGEIQNVTVSDQLKNISDLKEFTDKSDLEHIENVKGDETFTSKDGSLIWNTNNADICYQGTTNKALPVNVKVTYLLDGKTVRADELSGKSGHLTIRYTYENLTGKDGSTTTPFLMATGIVLDNNKFKNVTVTNGRLLSDGERELAVGFGIPAIQEMLGTDTLEIPDYFEIEADVTDYEPAEAMTIATNHLFNDLDTDGFDSLTELQHSMGQLQNASAQLVSGSGELRTGLDTLLSSSGSLTDGINRLADGSTSLADGTQTLKNGADGLYSGLNTASSKVSGELLPGIRALDAGVAQMQSSLAEGLPVLADGISALDSGISQVADGTAALNQGLGQVGAGASALNSGLSQVGSGTESLNENVQVLGTAIGQLNGMINPAQAAETDISGQAAALSAGASDLAGGLYAAAEQAGQAGTMAYSADAGTNSYDEIAALQSLLDNGMITDADAAANISSVIQSLTNEQVARDNAVPAVPDNSMLQNTLTGLASQADTLAGTAETIAASYGADPSNIAMMQQLQTVIGELNDKVNGTGGLVDSVAVLNAAVNTGDGTAANPGLAAGAAQLDAALNTGDGTNPSIISAAGQLNAAMNSGNAEAGVSSIRDGIAALDQVVNGEGGLSGQVTTGISQLKDGTSKLAAGVDGENGLAAGLNLLNAGAAQLAGGSDSLNTGANTLADGILTLQNGSGTLIDGVRQLDDGAIRLNSGMIQFDQDGIQKLVDAFDGDVDELLTKANNMLDSSKAYKNFSGIADGMDGEVKFVFVTE